MCTTRCLEEVYYTAVGCLSFFSFCRLGGIIVISGVRICKVAIFNCAIHTSGVTERMGHRGMVAFVI